MRMMKTFTCQAPMQHAIKSTRNSVGRESHPDAKRKNRNMAGGPNR